MMNYSEFTHIYKNYTSGNVGHAGRKGKVGGSLPKGIMNPSGDPSQADENQQDTKAGAPAAKTLDRSKDTHKLKSMELPGRLEVESAYKIMYEASDDVTLRKILTILKNEEYADQVNEVFNKHGIDPGMKDKLIDRIEMELSNPAEDKKGEEKK